MDPAVKQQAVERLRQANEILVTVSANPSIDQLAACIGTTLMLNKLGKHASAIFSGTVPSTLEFLQPEKTIEHDIDNLRDFIISLDKSKADKLHFKVEDDIVRIYITPYKTSLAESDLSFGQGDYNVEVVLALGVQNRTQVDTALAAHGRILHDATIVAVTSGGGKPSDLGQINWQDTTASSLCEMMVSISESFGSGLIDSQMATAFLTGIVSETERFRNPKTTPKVMTMSAQLMAAGANQQLIASKLELDTPSQTAAKPAPSGPKEGTIKVDHPIQSAAAQPQPVAAPTSPAPEIKTRTNKPAESASPLKLDPTSDINIDPEGNITTARGKFVPAPADFTPPAAAETLPPANLPPASGIPEDVPLPGEHTLLDPSHHQPTFDQSFSADTEPKWDTAKPPAFSAEVGGQADSVEAARAAVEQATSAASAFQLPPELQKDQSSAASNPKPPIQPDAAPSAPPLPPPLPDSVIQGSATDSK